jgi:hypothetical protein
VLGHDQFSAAIAVAGRVPARWKQTTPLNTAIMFVPQQEAWVVERMGKFHRVLDPGNIPYLIRTPALMLSVSVVFQKSEFGPETMFSLVLLTPFGKMSIF